MNLEGIMLSETSQTDTVNTVWYHLYVESKKKQTNEQTKWKQTHRYREQRGSCQRGGCGGWEIKKYKLSVIK